MSTITEMSINTTAITVSKISASTICSNAMASLAAMFGPSSYVTLRNDEVKALHRLGLVGKHDRLEQISTVKHTRAERLQWLVDQKMSEGKFDDANEETRFQKRNRLGDFCFNLVAGFRDYARFKKTDYASIEGLFPTTEKFDTDLVARYYWLLKSTINRKGEFIDPVDETLFQVVRNRGEDRS